MPKPYTLKIDIEEIALGKVMRVLHALPGIVKIHMDLNDTPKKRSKANGSGGPTARQSLFKFLLASKKPVTTTEIRELFTSLNAAVPSSMMTTLKSDGYLRQPKPKTWEATAKARQAINLDGTLKSEAK